MGTVTSTAVQMLFPSEWRPFSNRSDQPNDTIAVNAARHQDLISTLDRLSYVPSALGDKVSQLNNERVALKTVQDDCVRLEEKQRAAFAALQSLKTTRTRLSYKVKHGRRADEALATETQSTERRYEATFAEGQLMLERVGVIRARISLLEAEEESLSLLEAQRLKVDGQLCILYEDVFRGPTPGHADEDEVESAVCALELQVKHLQAEIEHDTTVLGLLASLIKAMEHAERQFKKAQQAAQRNDHYAKREHHKDKSKKLYAAAVRIEAEIAGMHAFRFAAGAVPRGDGPRKHHCRRLVTQYKASMGEVIASLSRLEEELESAEKALSSAKADLRELRCMIMMQALAPPPQFEEPPVYCAKE